MIRTSNLRKQYRTHDALKGIDLSVNEGDVYGFIGPNGAGKTTTLRILTTLLEPTSGTAEIDGLSVWDNKTQVRSIIGYMPDDFGVYRDMTVNEYLHFFAAAYGIPAKKRNDLVSHLLDLVDLVSKKNAMIDALSRGMQQRLGLARTLVHDPKVLILDEPASGLDPRARIDIREILRELQSMGKTILLSSHILSELQEVCSRIGILEQGRLVAQGSVAEVIAQSEAVAEVVVRTTDNARAALVLREHASVSESTYDEELDTVYLTVATGTDLVELSGLLQSKSLHLRHLELREPTLEEVFMSLTEENAQ